MIETKHTPGPWRAEYSTEHVTVECSNPEISTTIAELVGRPSPEIFANARLIAAAPDMLEALKHVWSAIEEQHLVARDPDFIEGRGAAAAAQAVRAAIAKATRQS